MRRDNTEQEETRRNKTGQDGKRRWQEDSETILRQHQDDIKTTAKRIKKEVRRKRDVSVNILGYIDTYVLYICTSRILLLERRCHHPQELLTSSNHGHRLTPILEKQNTESSKGDASTTIREHTGKQGSNQYSYVERTS